MKTQKVVSREYKLMLHPAKFAGSEPHLLAVAGEFWGELVGAIAPFVVRADGALDTISKHRLVSFLDSRGRHLWVGGYVLRLRRTLEGFVEQRPCGQLGDTRGIDDRTHRGICRFVEASRERRRVLRLRRERQQPKRNQRTREPRHTNHS